MLLSDVLFYHMDIIDINPKGKKAFHLDAKLTETLLWFQLHISRSCGYLYSSVLP